MESMGEKLLEEPALTIGDFDYDRYARMLASPAQAAL